MHAQGCRFAVIGADGVGKSTVVFRFVNGEFVEDFDPTIADDYRKQYTLDDKLLSVEIVEYTSEYLNAMARDYRHAIKGYMFMYAITSKQSLEDMKEIYKHFEDGYAFFSQNPDNGKALVIVGNKSDLQEHRQVSAEEGEALAKEWGCKFYEISAKTNENLDNVFETIITDTYAIAKGSKKRIQKKKKKQICTAM